MKRCAITAVSAVLLLACSTAHAVPINIASQANGGIATANNNPGAAERANDGNTDGAFGSGSVWEAITNPGGAVWEVALPAHVGMELTNIVLFNRTDCCTDRLDDFRVDVLDASNVVLFTHTNNTLVPIGPNPQTNPPAGLNLALPGGITTATKVQVVNLQGNSPFHIAEVEVYADNIVPEPMSSLMIGVGLLVVGAATRRYRQR